MVIAASLLAGCSRRATQPPSGWEYKVVSVENSDHGIVNSASAMMQTNVVAALKAVRLAKADAGSFHLESGPNGEYSDYINVLGAQGWELVSAVPQIETIPDAEQEVGTAFNPDTKTLASSFFRFSNVRTGRIILIFKRRL